MPIPEITVDDLAVLLAGDVRLVDVRTSEEYEAGHVPGAVSVPLATVPENVGAFAGDGPVYLICKVGGRSMSACAYLIDHGMDVVNVAGGTDAWIMAGRDVTTGQDPV
jgi:rhodanese-related sulfurtransferase